MKSRYPCQGVGEGIGWGAGGSRVRSIVDSMVGRQNSYKTVYTIFQRKHGCHRTGQDWARGETINSIYYTRGKERWRGLRGGIGRAGCTHFMHSPSRMTVDPRIPSTPGRSTPGFDRPDRYRDRQARKKGDVRRVA